MDKSIIALAFIIEIFLHLYLILKVNWVRGKRIYLIYNNQAKYKELPDFRSMSDGKYWWCWDINEIIKMHKKDRNK